MPLARTRQGRCTLALSSLGRFPAGLGCLCCGVLGPVLLQGGLLSLSLSLPLIRFPKKCIPVPLHPAAPHLAQ
jgi:hypothetical protein